MAEKTNDNNFDNIEQAKVLKEKAIHELNKNNFQEVNFI